MSVNELDQRKITIETSCRDCIWAKFNDEYTHQIGCQLERLNKFQRKNLVSETQDTETGLKYFKIHRLCNICRNQEWANRFEDPLKAVTKEIQIKVDIIILDQNDEELCNIPDPDWEERLNTSINSATAQTIKPNKIILGLYQKTTNIKPLINKLNQINIRNEIVNVIKNCKNMGQFIDEVVKKSQSQYYMLCEYNDILPTTSIARLNKAINENLDQLSMVYPFVGNGWHGLTVQTLLHNTISGNHNIDIREKIKELATNQNNLGMIKQWHQLPQ